MEETSRRTRPGRLFLAGAALCAANASAAEKGAIAVGAIVLPSTLCRAASTGTRCVGSVPAPRVENLTTKLSGERYAGQVVVRMTPAAAAMDSRQTTIPSAERIAVTITP